MYRTIELTLHVICALALVIMMSVGAADIILGELFNMYLPFKVELSGLLFAVVIFLSQPLVMARREHVVVDIFSSRLKSGWKLLSLVIANVTAITVLVLLTFASWQLFTSSLAFNEKSIDFLQIPIYPVKFLVFLGFLFTILVAGLQLIQLFRHRDKKTLPQESDSNGGTENG
ncbi:TRAP transporter small permease [uncultured Sneathiella sp.]|uniref:TRAP transporter small permease n=1 Tax=uncultured Sneathiella sp. TaxID=879315 RepID=UPI0030EC0632|tara:strand:- start:36867 stop:37385 length:519 start_codon:yes stop_codon:yes gene_type:complete